MKKLFHLLVRVSVFAALFFFAAECASAQGSLANFPVWRYTPAGAFPAGGSTVTVCTNSASGAPCSPTITIYQDAGLTIPVSNPLAVCTTSPQIGCLDGLGNATFYATPGQYSYTVTGAGLRPYGPIALNLPCVVGVSCVSPTSPNTFTQPQTFSAQIVSTVATGTAPFSIVSTTVVPNLNTQLHGGLAAPGSAILGLTDAQSPTNKTLDISLNTLKTATNTAGHVPRNNGTQYVDGQLAATDLSTPLQGTDANLLTSGTVSASTGIPLCTDANHGATTSGCTSGGVSEAAFPCLGAGFIPGAVVDPSAACGYVLFAQAHTLIRLTAFATQVPAGCTTAAVIAFRDETSGTSLTTVTITNGAAFDDSGAISVAMTAGHKFAVAVTTAESGCSTAANLILGAVYQ